MSSARRSAPARLRHRLLAVVTLGALVLSACGTSGGDEVVTAQVRATKAKASQLRGSWPSVTTTTALPGLDPTTGLGISGPFGPPWPEAFLAADAVVGSVDLYQSPGVRVPTNRSLPNPTVENVRLVMLVREQFTDDKDQEWLQVQINQRPNGATAWIKRTDVDLRFVPNHVLIELGAKRVTVFHADKAIWSTSVAPGKSSSPTPLGSFYVDVLAKPYNPNGPYGAYQISFTGFSTVYSSFGGGNGQVAMHGTNRPELIGTPASHGCVRMSNDDITFLLRLAPQGTPVDVVA